MVLENGIFTISLDFELYWGVRDKRSIELYGENLRGVRHAINCMLELFEEKQIHATWATVGFLQCRDLADLHACSPATRPAYLAQQYSPYQYINSARLVEDQLHFAPEVVAKIASKPGQEIGTHTFSHFYCLEKGQTIEDFKADIAAAKHVASRSGLVLKSLVFPRNQWNGEYLKALPEFGILSYRGNELAWIYRASANNHQGPVVRLLRLLDAYLNIYGHHTHNLNSEQGSPLNFPSSRFLRPFSRRLKWLERLRLRRILNAMDDAAKKRRLFHLWWHPHNFGTNTEENMNFLNEILNHFQYLNKTYGMKSMNMGELAGLSGEMHG